jgi:hypothetical protein
MLIDHLLGLDQAWRSLLCTRVFLVSLTDRCCALGSPDIYTHARRSPDVHTHARRTRAISAGGADGITELQQTGEGQQFGEGVIATVETAVQRGRNHELPETDSRFSVQASASISSLYYNLRQPRGEVFILFINDQVIRSH